MEVGRGKEQGVNCLLSVGAGEFIEVATTYFMWVQINFGDHKILPVDAREQKEVVSSTLGENSYSTYQNLKKQIVVCATRWIFF